MIPILVVGAGGRMGRTICSLVQEAEDLELCGMVDRVGFQAAGAPAACKQATDLAELAGTCPKNSVIIDFSSPESSLHSGQIAAEAGLGLVIGTTGLTASQKEALSQLAVKTSIFWSPNMSIGVSVLQKILPELTKALGEDYDIDILEVHHNRKKDAPSGTALRLAECIADARNWKLDDVRCSGRDGIIGPRPRKQIGVQALRGGDVVGVHTVYFMGPGECIEVTHRAQSRENFARGALRAARWIADRKPGKLYSMNDLF